MNAIHYSFWHTLRRELTRPSTPTRISGSFKLDRCNGVARSWSHDTVRAFPAVDFKNGARALHTSLAARNPRFRGPSSVLPSHQAGPSEGLKIYLSQRATHSIFKGSLSQEHANDLLSKVQVQRERGTLDNGIEEYTSKAVEDALVYLRSRYPIDEEAAIVARIDNELDHDFRLPQTDVEYSRDQKSGLKEIREVTAEREKREEERQKKLEQRLHHAQHRQHLLPTTNQQLGKEARTEVRLSKPRKFTDLMNPERKRKEPPEWIKKLREEATEKDIPNLNLRQRLLPGALFSTAVVLLSLWFADTYVPPSREARLFPDVPPAAACVQTIVLANVAIFLLWKLPHMWKFLNKYFIAPTMKPRPAQLFFATVSHQSLSHLVTNMVVLWLIGVRLHDDIGRGPFLALFVSGGVLSTYATLVAHTWKNLFFTATLGASGTVAALIATSCVLHEGLEVKLPFFPGLDMSWLNTGVILAIIVLFEVSRLRRGILNHKSFEKTGIMMDHIGHTGGYLVGIAAALHIRNHDPRWRDMERRSFWSKSRWKETDPLKKSVVGDGNAAGEKNL